MSTRNFVLGISLALTFTACGKKSSTSDTPSTASAIPCVGKIIFVTAVSSGNLGGTAGADSTCNANKPTGFSGSNFKALIATNSGSRRAACFVAGNDNCGTSVAGQTDWPLVAGTTYCSKDYVNTVGTADVYGHVTPTSGNAVSSSALNVYMGMNTAWGVSNRTTAPTSNGNCTDFSSNSSSLNGNSGVANVTGQDWYASVFTACNVAANIYCVEQ